MGCLEDFMGLKINITTEECDTELDLFRKILNKGDYYKAKEIADNLVENGTPVTLINDIGYNIIRRGGAERLAEIFKDYKWHRWLEEKN